ncbi:MAG TPA: transglutaminase-like domain-containing protein [Pseudonocardia sp.]|jgi:regulator of sirC expression with transglutaminase-like and TPR domain|nr:transglutaminase-like domain-containing protein [Pseudonocardia sp.]
MSSMDAVARFAELVARPDPPLDQAALALAAGADPTLDPAPWLAELDRLAAGVDSLDALVHRLFVVESFAGNERRYQDPRNSLLNHVLARRLGIPITLAVVTIEVGRRAGVALEGVGMPGHFLVRVPDTEHYLDVFDGGRRLNPTECEARFRSVTGAGAEVPFGPHLLRTASTTAILTRMLENLRAVFRSRRRPFDLEWVLRMRLALPGGGLPEVAELAEALGGQARWQDGARLLEQQVPSLSSPQAAQVRAAARALRAHLN